MIIYRVNFEKRLILSTTMKETYIKHRYTPEKIESLREGEIFVFGSNLAGHHGGGAANIAFKKFDAIWGQGVGLQGQCYAIPTMQGGVDTIKPYVEEFVSFAKQHSEFTFLVTKIGCGIAGFSEEEIAPLFMNALQVENIVLPESFENIIKSVRPLDCETINYFIRRLKEKNPHRIGTLSYGFWEQKEKFELLWDSYDHHDWHQFFKEFKMEEEFERGVELTDDWIHQPTNKDWVFKLYWSAIFPPEKISLLEQCHYHKGEEVNPFGEARQMWCHYEMCWVRFHLDKNHRDTLDYNMKVYLDNGFGDLCPNDGVPMSMKALLLNRWLHWGGAYGPIEDFRKWYISIDYTNIHEGKCVNDLLNDLPKEYLYFWGHHAKDGKITKACLSQWYPCKFTVDGVHYNSAEQYMMAEKARLMGDEYVRQQILASTDPKEIKDLGKAVKNFDEDLWCQHRSKIVAKGNYYKFLCNTDLKKFLHGTGNKILVEASPYDVIWGIGMKEDDANANNPYAWKGMNLLGFTLMEVRERLKNIKN